MFFKPALAILPLAILGACASDDVLVNNNTGQVADKSEVRYLRVSICNPGGASGTRAIGDNDDDYANGTDDENKIKTLDFYFYDDSKDYHSHASIVNKDAEIPNGTSTLNTVDRVYTTNVPVTLVQGEKLPAYVLCLVNAVAPNAQEGKPMADAQQYLLNDIYDLDSKQYFGMNNSVYYGTDEVKGSDNQLIMATPFEASKLKTADELNESTVAEEANIDIYVERYAAKIKLNTSNTAVSDFISANGLTLKFTPHKWGMNAYEKEFYLVKCYRQKDNPTEFDTEENLNNILFPGWNRSADFRSFWTRSPAYFDDNYPIVTDDIKDVCTYKPESRMTDYPYTVFYSTFNSAGYDLNNYEYIMESTLKGERLNGEGMPDQYLPINSIPSVVLTGRYKVGDYEANKTFYTYGKDSNGKPYVYAANDGDFGDINTIKDVMITAQNIVLVKEGNSYRSIKNVDLTNDGDDAIFTVSHPSKEVRNNGDLKIAGDIVTLQMNTLNNKELYFYSSRSNATGYTRIQESNLTEVNRLLYQNLGGAHIYKDGMAFFTAPVQHWGWYRENNKAEKTTNAEGKVTYNGGNNGRPMDQWDWSQMKAGDFGIVRNHIYTINISKIEGLGTGILDADDPLLPSAEKVGYSVHFNVNIQKWAMLPVQNWEW